MDFLLDPFIVALPDSSDSKDSLENYAFSLSLWANEVSKGKHKIWLSGWIISALYDEKQYPTWEKMKQLSWDQSVFSAYDLFRSCERSLVTPPYIEDELKNGHYHYDLVTTIVLPNEIEKRLKPGVSQALKETLICIGIAKEFYSHLLANNLFFATTLVPDGDTTIAIDTTLHDIESDSEKEINSEWKTVLSPSELDEIKDLSSFWEDSNQAIKWAHKNLCRKGILDDKKHYMANFMFGKRFNESIKEYHFDNQPNILPAIFETIARVVTAEFPRNVRGHHELRLSDEASSPARVRKSDGAIGWRVWVTKSKPAVRLHYWLVDEKFIELSKVGPHEDYDIY